MFARRLTLEQLGQGSVLRPWVEGLFAGWLHVSELFLLLGINEPW